MTSNCIVKDTEDNLVNSSQKVSKTCVMVYIKLAGRVHTIKSTSLVPLQGKNLNFASMN